mmetsp:Transcript_35669/g.89991  ORF Transcript_35669/g.89991 Transcript_35669/m.89991 type:complete len:204 (-) Transcript_35669:235-846(-)
MIEWANRTLRSVDLVLRGCPLPQINPSILVSLTLINPYQIPTLQSLTRLTHLTIAFSTAAHIPQPRKLSSICPPGVASITLLRATIVIDKLPKACSRMSLTMCKNINTKALRSHLRVLRLDNCNINDITLTHILSNCPNLETLLLPNNKPCMLKALQDGPISFPHCLRSLDISSLTSDCTCSRPKALPDSLEELSLSTQVVRS